MRPIELLLSDTVQSPLAIGFLRPAIVMPSTIVLELCQEEFDDLGVHELAHIRRYDDWANLLLQFLTANRGQPACSPSQPGTPQGVPG